MVVCSGGRDLHICPFGQVRLIESSDAGESWSDERVLVDGPLDDRDSGIIQTPGGAILVFWFTSLLLEHYENAIRAAAEEGAESWMDAARLERWQRAVEKLKKMDDATVKRELGCWVIRSDDGGRTWSEKQRVPLNAPHGAIVQKDGSLFYAGREVWQGGERVGVAQSADDGRNWQWLTELPVAPGDQAEQYHELHAAEADDRRLVVQIRNHNEQCKGETLQCESDDGGRTWTTPHSIGVWGFPSHLLKLRDGRLVMTYGYRRDPIGNQARTSDDGGRTWSEAMIVQGDATNHDLGYPSSVELDDGTIATLWYECVKAPYPPEAVLRLARWTIKD